MPPEATLTGYVPGAIGRITELHAAYYSEHWNLGRYFETKVAGELAAFVERLEPERDGMWLAHIDKRIVGSVVIDGRNANGIGARLRWFIVDPKYQGHGIGKLLMNAAMTFCREKRYTRVYLTTFAGLDAARHLYEKYGFALCGESDASQLTGRAELIEQEFEYIPPDA